MCSNYKETRLASSSAAVADKITGAASGAASRHSKYLTGHYAPSSRQYRLAQIERFSKSRKVRLPCMNGRKRNTKETNRAYCSTIGDDSQASWADPPDWQKNSAIEGVKFHLANPQSSASASHDSWLKVKEADRWRYGPLKDADKKEHPC
ncbi:MAG: hypothetical protein ACR2IE_16875 [Candidatus Sumerlaeaceae bacterium]